MRNMLFGVISDTHGYFDERLRYIFAGVRHIFHCGDVGTPDVLLALETIAPVTAVRGNADSAYLQLPTTQKAEIEGLRFLIKHEVSPLVLDPETQCLIEEFKPHAMFFGHSHKPFVDFVNNILFVNPGYAGRPKYEADRSVALVRFENNQFAAEIIPLKHCIM